MSASKVFRSAIIMLSLVGLTACAGLSGNSGNADAEKANPLILQGSGVEGRVKLLKSRNQLNGELREAVIEIQNVASYSLKLESKMVWYDKDGFELKAQFNSWLPIVLQADEIKTMNSVAPLPEAVDFKLYLRAQ